MKTKLLFVFITTLSATTAFAKEGSPMFEARMDNRAAAIEEQKEIAISQKNEESVTTETANDDLKAACC